MGHLLIQRPFGSLVIGNTGEGSGFGSQAIGQDHQGLMRFGSLDTGNREEEVGSGIEDIGNIVENDKFGAKSSEFGAKFK
jgi:hypothetical protein